MPLTTYEGYLGRGRLRQIPGLGSIPVRKLTVRDIDLVYRSQRENTLAASTIRQFVVQDCR